MWLIDQKLKGIDPPATLTPEMIPPSFRSKQENQPVRTLFNPNYYLIKQSASKIFPVIAQGWNRTTGLFRFRLSALTY